MQGHHHLADLHLDAVRADLRRLVDHFAHALDLVQLQEGISIFIRIPSVGVLMVELQWQVHLFGKLSRLYWFVMIGILQGTLSH